MPGKQLPIGIDLGTSTSEICVFRNGRAEAIPNPFTRSRSPIVPSIVAVNERGELVIGEDARNLKGADDRVLREVKRHMKETAPLKLAGKEYLPEQISALILKQLKEIAEIHLGQPIVDVVLSVPANFEDVARQATLNAGKLAGLNILRLINEPTAAALAFGMKFIDLEEKLMVFDFGGGTLDITVFEMMSKVLDIRTSHGDTQLGGKDFDAVVRKLGLERFRAEHPQAEIIGNDENSIKNAAEDVKMMLSRERAARMTVLSGAFENGRPVTIDPEITRAEFHAAARPLIDRARRVIDDTLEKGGLSRSEISRVILVGGTTYMPIVRELVAECLGVTPRHDVDPDLAVCQGAAIHAAALMGELPEDADPVLLDVAPKGFGVDTLDTTVFPPVLIYDELIACDTKVPYSTSKMYRLLHTEQDILEMNLYQNDGMPTFEIEEVDATGAKVEITDIPVSDSDEPHPVLVEFNYDLNGIIELKATIPTTGQTAACEWNQDSKRYSQADMQKQSRDVEALWRTNPRFRLIGGMVGKIEAAMPTLSDAKRREALVIVRDARNALESQSGVDLESIEDRLADFVAEL